MLGIPRPYYQSQIKLVQKCRSLHVPLSPSNRCEKQLMGSGGISDPLHEKPITNAALETRVPCDGPTRLLADAAIVRDECSRKEMVDWSQ